MTAPERIWTTSTSGRCYVGFATPSESYRIPYILATPEALASSPEVAALIAEARREGWEQLLLLETMRKSIVAGPMPGEDMRHWIERQMRSASTIRALKETTP